MIILLLKSPPNSRIFLPNEEVCISAKPDPWTRKRSAADRKQEPVNTLVWLSAGLQHLGRQVQMLKSPSTSQTELQLL